MSHDVHEEADEAEHRDLLEDRVQEADHVLLVASLQVPGTALALDLFFKVMFIRSLP